MDLLILLLVLYLVVELGMTITCFEIKKVLELKMMKDLTDKGLKTLDDVGMMSKFQIDLGGDIFVPFKNIKQVFKILINFKDFKEECFSMIQDRMYPLSPLEEEVYKENPSYFTLMRLPSKVYKRLNEMEPSIIVDEADGSTIFYKRLENGDISILHVVGFASVLDIQTLKEIVIRENNKLEMAKKDSEMRQESEKISEKQKQIEHLKEIEKDLIETKSELEQSEFLSDTREKVYTKEKNRHHK